MRLSLFSQTQLPDHRMSASVRLVSPLLDNEQHEILTLFGFFVGTDAMDLYFPSRCVSEEELEKFDGVAAGKVSSLRLSAELLF